MQQSVSLKLNRLDWTLLAIIASFVLWLWVKESGSLAYHWQWSRALDLLFTRKSDGSLPYFFDGVFSTLRLTFWGMLFALVFGVLLGLGRRSPLAVIRAISNSYIQLIRNIPPLVFIFIFYFFIANQLVPLFGLESLLREHNGNINAVQSFLFGSANLWENLIAGVLCIGMISAAYIGEVVRSGLDAIPQGQHEAARSLGLSTWDRYRYIIAPQVFKVIIPSLAGQCISLVKDSSIISLISIQELTFVGTEIANSSGMIFEIWIVVALCYFILCFGLSRLFAYWEKNNVINQ